jgi:hypothetical protein
MKTISGNPEKPMWERDRLAGDGGLSVNDDVDSDGLSAGKPVSLPQVFAVLRLPDY